MKIEQLFEDLNKRFSYRRSSLAMANAKDIKPYKIFHTLAT